MLWILASWGYSLFAPVQEWIIWSRRSRFDGNLFGGCQIGAGVVKSCLLVCAQRPAFLFAIRVTDNIIGVPLFGFGENHPTNPGVPPNSPISFWRRDNIRNLSVAPELVLCSLCRFEASQLIVAPRLRLPQIGPLKIFSENGWFPLGFPSIKPKKCCFLLGLPLNPQAKNSPGWTAGASSRSQSGSRKFFRFPPPPRARFGRGRIHSTSNTIALSGGWPRLLKLIFFLIFCCFRQSLCHVSQWLEARLLGSRPLHVSANTRSSGSIAVW